VHTARCNNIHENTKKATSDKRNQSIVNTVVLLLFFVFFLLLCFSIFTLLYVFIDVRLSHLNNDYLLTYLQSFHVPVQAACITTVIPTLDCSTHWLVLLAIQNTIVLLADTSSPVVSSVM